MPKVAENCLTSMYVDDTELEHDIKPQDIQLMETTINNNLDKLRSYFKSNKLCLNVPKCTLVLVWTQQILGKCNELNIKIGNESIPQATKSNNLGMQVENTLRWNAHIDQLVKILSSIIGILRRHWHIGPSATLLQLYNAIVVPHFDYGDIVYESCTQNNLDRLQKMQNQAARIISGSSHHTHRNDMYAGLNWLSLKIDA